MHIVLCPQVILSDQGREFCNRVTNSLFTENGITHRVTSAYHPQANGLTEKFNGTLLNMLTKAVVSHPSLWDTKLQSVLFASNTSIHRSTGYSPFFLLYGRCVVYILQAFRHGLFLIC